jgi:hypothetical protein
MQICVSDVCSRNVCETQDLCNEVSDRLDLFILLALGFMYRLTHLKSYTKGITCEVRKVYRSRPCTIKFGYISQRTELAGNARRWGLTSIRRIDGLLQPSKNNENVQLSVLVYGFLEFWIMIEFWG